MFLTLYILVVIVVEETYIIILLNHSISSSSSGSFRFTNIAFHRTPMSLVPFHCVPSSKSLMTILTFERLLFQVNLWV